MGPLGNGRSSEAEQENLRPYRIYNQIFKGR